MSASSSSSSLEGITSTLLARSATEVPLTPKKVWNQNVQQEINSLPTSKGKEANQDVLKAALHLLNDDLHNAHELAQAHEESMTANLIHATLHRREKDYWNSKWWLSRVSHPLIKQVYNSTAGAKKFVDEVERSESTSGSVDENREKLQELQLKELKAIVDYARKDIE